MSVVDFCDTLAYVPPSVLPEMTYDPDSGPSDSAAASLLHSQFSRRPSRFMEFTTVDKTSKVDSMTTSTD